MQNKIKKLSISMERGGLKMPKPNEMEQQKLTIKNNGQVWWTGLRNFSKEEIEKGFGADGNIVKKVKLSEYKNIGKENALKILERAQEILPKHIDTECRHLICDASLDEVLIEYDDGEFLVGQLDALTYELDEVEEFYDYLAEELLIENLFMLEGYCVED